jgi:hypothetical protein
MPSEDSLFLAVACPEKAATMVTSRRAYWGASACLAYCLNTCDPRASDDPIIDASPFIYIQCWQYLKIPVSHYLHLNAFIYFHFAFYIYIIILVPIMKDGDRLTSYY